MILGERGAETEQSDAPTDDDQKGQQLVALVIGER